MDVVRGIEDAAELVAQRLVQIETALRDVAVDADLVLVAAADAERRRVVAERLETAQHFAAVFLVALALGEVKAEQADVLRAEDLRDLDRVLERFKMRPEIVRDLDLAVGGADRRHADARLVQRRFHFARFVGRDVVDALAAVQRAQLDVGDAVRLAGRDLLTDVRRRLVRKSGDQKFCHDEPPLF